MGRHSAPDDGDDTAATADTVVLSPPDSGARGRHAASDSGADSAGEVPTVADAPTGELPSVGGRPTVADAPTGEVPAVDEVDPAAAPEDVAPADVSPDDVPSADGGSKAAGRPGRATVADASLVRRHRDVQTQLAAAVLVPFALYVVVLIIVGSTVRQGLLWIFVPLVVAGVLVGAFLDAGHKRHAKPTKADDLHDS